MRRGLAKSFSHARICLLFLRNGSLITILLSWRDICGVILSLLLMLYGLVKMFFLVGFGGGIKYLSLRLVMLEIFLAVRVMFSGETLAKRLLEFGMKSTLVSHGHS